MSSVLFIIVTVALLVFHAWSDRNWRIERKRLMDAILAKHAPEFMSMQRDRPPVVIQKQQPENIFPEGL